MRKLLLFFFLLTAFKGLKAQYRLEYGGSLGVGSYLGEIGGIYEPRGFIMDVQKKYSRPSLGAYIRYKFLPTVLVKGSLQMVSIAGADSLSKDPGRHTRNLSFRNNIIELSGQVEYNFLGFNNLGKIQGKRVDFRSYIFAGAGVFYHNPEAKYQGSWVALRPLKTEGQGIVEGKKEYGKIAVCFPLGLGVSAIVGRKYRFTLETGWRKTNTDYLDDVSTTYVKDPSVLPNDLSRSLANRSQEASNTYPEIKSYMKNASIRGNPNTRDSYIATTLGVGIIIKGKNSFYRSKYNYVTGVKRKMKKRKVRAKF